MKLLLTRELGRLAKWLRIMGVDAEYSRQKNNASLVIQALKEERTILTRNHRLPAARGIKIAVLKEELLRLQLEEVFELLGLAPQPEELFTRCTVCNLRLADIGKDKVKDKVPEYVFQTQEKFLTCPSCGRIYWQGTHRNNVEKALKAINSKT